MSGISSLGVGSGLDLNSLVSSLLTAERAPTQNRLDRAQGQAQTQLSAIGSLRSAASALLGSVTALGQLTTQYRAIATGAAAVTATVSADGGAEPGAYQVRVSALASAQSLASQAFADADAPLGSGTLTLRVGDTEAAIEIGPDVGNLRQVRDAINASEAGIQAALVRDGDAFRLLLTSRTAGSAGAMQLQVSGSVDGRLAHAAMTETAPAANASFSVNGLALSSSSNRIDGVIPGVTLTLAAITDGADATTVSIERDQSAVRNRLGALVTAYNALRDNIGTLTSFNAATGDAGPLLGDSSARGLQSRLAGIFSAPLVQGAATPQRMLDIGFSTDLSGKVSLDEARLDAALSEDQGAVEELVAVFAEGFATVLGGYAGPGGILQTRVDGLNERLRQIGRQRGALDDRMLLVEARLRAQFTALDSMVAQFQNTSRYLTDQLASLADLRPGRRD